MKSYTVGTQITLTGTFRDGTGALVDPTNVTGELRKPDQTVVPLVVTKQSVGVYTAPYTPVYAAGVSPNGLHLYRFVGAGAVVAASEGGFLVESDFTS